MGCTQSVPATGPTAAEGCSSAETTASSKHGNVGSSAIRVSFNGKTESGPTKQVRDSVHDISANEAKGAKAGHADSSRSVASKCDDGEADSDRKRAVDDGILATPSGSPGNNSPSSNRPDDPKPGHDGPGSNRTAGASSTAAASSAPEPLPPGHGQRNSSIDNQSTRSSFAAEGILGGGRQAAGRARISESHLSALPAALEAARSSTQARMSSIQAADVMGVGGDKAAVVLRGPATHDPLSGFQPPAAVATVYPLLGALPPDTPVPLEVLQQLWKAGSAEEALGMGRALASVGILRLASLEDGSCWALPAPQHVAHAAAVWPEVVVAVHGQLVESYTRKGAVALEGLRDDGYIIQALSHHLVGAGNLDALRRLLMNPGWLEAKLHAYGVGAVVRDFRRYLQDADSEDGAHDVKLLLQAFQLSLGAAMEHPSARMMREQMLARLMAVAAGGRLQEWFAEQTAKCAAESMLGANSRLLHLMPRSPSLAQAGGVQRMTLRGHQGAITRVAIAPSCCDVVTISEDGTAQVWDMNIGDCVMHLARNAPLTAVGVTPNSAVTVVAAADGTAAVWSLATGQVTHTLKGHTSRINALAIDKQGIRVLTGSEDHTARVWNLNNGACEAVLEGHGGAAGIVGSVLDVCVSSDGTLAVTVSDDFSGRVWDMDEDGELMHVLEGHGGWVTSAAFVGTSQRVITASHDTTARIWDALKGRCLFVLSGHSGRLNRVSVDPGGSWAITSSDDHTARVWDCETGEIKLVLEGHSAHVTDAAITRDGRKAVTVSGDGACAIWDMATGRREVMLEGHSGEVVAVALTQRGRFAVTAGKDCTARVWDLAVAAEAPPPQPTHSGRVSALQPLPDGQLVVSAGDDGRIMLWDPIEGVCLKQLDGHRVGVRFMRVSADGERVLTGSGDRQICNWNWSEYSAAASVVGLRRSLERRDLLLQTGTCSVGGLSTTPTALGRALGTMRGTADAALGGGGATAAGPADAAGGGGRNSEEEDPMAALEALKPGGGRGGGGSFPAPRATAPSLPHCPPGSTSTVPPPGLKVMRHSRSLVDMVATFQTDPLQTSMPAQQGSRVKHMAFDGECRRVAVLLFDSTVSIWDVGSGNCTAQLIRRGERDSSRTHSGGVNAVYLTKDGRTAVTISKDNTARVWDVETATTRFVVEGHTDGLVAADISGDETLLATAAYDKTVRVSRMTNGSAVAVLDHPQPPMAVSFSPDSRWMAVGLDDHTVVVWDLVGRCCLPSLDAHKAPLAVLTWSPDSRFLLTAGQDCTLRLWRLQSGRQQAFFMADAGITSACFAGHPMSDIVVAGDAAGNIHFLDFAEELQG